MKGTGIMKKVRFEDDLEHVEYYKTGYYRAYPMFGYSNWNWQYQDIIWNQNFQKKEMRKIRKRRLIMARS